VGDAVGVAVGAALAADTGGSDTGAGVALPAGPHPVDRSADATNAALARQTNPLFISSLP
jgi:hypothetical protein